MGDLLKVLGGLSEHVAKIQSATVLEKHLAFVKAQLEEATKKATALEAENAKLRERVAHFESEAAAQERGDPCPICRKPELFVYKEEDDPIFGVTGAKAQSLRCNACGHETSRIRQL